MSAAAGRTFAVIGGGITGLAAARELATLTSPADRIVVIERDGRLGGKIRTDRLGGARVEAGPDCFLAREPWAVELCRDLGMADELIEPEGFGGWVWAGGSLARLPPGLVFGVPTSLRSLRAAGVLSVRGRARALADLVAPTALSGPDVTIGAFVRRRFGREVLDRLVDPVLAGTRAGDPDALSLAAATPELDRLARSRRSLLAGRTDPVEDGPLFLAPRAGMGSLIEKLRAGLARTEMRLGRAALRVRAHGDGFVVDIAGDEPVVAHGVVVAAPTFAAADLLEGLDPDAAQLLRTIAYSSVALVTLIYPPGSVALPDHGSGFLVPRSERRMLAACTWYSRKWPGAVHDEEGIVLRCFAGRGENNPALALDDDELALALHAEAAEALPIAAGPRVAGVVRWERGLPHYAVGHLDLVDRIEHALAPWPRVALAGAGYRGSGIAKCIHQARRAARQLTAGL
ncbi:MAG: protoporphyrinogen oxidase [Actinomycetota bacterium]